MNRPADEAQPAEHDSADRLQHPGLIRRVPWMLSIAVSLACGIVTAEFVSLPVSCLLIVASVWLIAAGLLFRFGTGPAGRMALLLAVAALGAGRWHMFLQRSDTAFETLADQEPILTLRVRIAQPPVVVQRPQDSLSGFHFGAARQTRFNADCLAILRKGRPVPVSGRLQIFVERDATDRLAAGDTVDLTGRLSVARPPSNPGQFDYAARLRRQGICARLFVNHPDAVGIRERSSILNPLRWSSILRRDCDRMVRQYVSPDVRGMAIALLLGDRNEIPTETEQSFVASGSMHLLAISGLHVGVLFLLVLRLLNLLIVKRRSALLLTLVVCVLYALMTGGRPSVVRATLFIGLFVVSEIFGRTVRLSSLIATTAVVMMTIRPWLVFDTGAWLSFLSVSALSWLAGPKPPDDSVLPPDRITLRERIQAMTAAGLQFVAYRQKQMLSILMFTAPVVAVGFHVVSAVGIVLNVALLCFIVPVLWLGFAMLFVGLLWAPLAAVPATGFSWGLQILQWIVETSARWHVGHLYLPDPAEWLIPVYYALLTGWLCSRRRPFKRLLLALLLISVCVGFASPAPSCIQGLRLTVLDVGHGNAAVVEHRGQVLLVDAGAMNRGEMAADIISEYLWSAGHRTISAILISHADVDHFNALPHLLRRFPVGELLLPRDVEPRSAAAIRRVLTGRSVDTLLRVVRTGDAAMMGDVQLRILQAEELPPNATDNERSLVAELSCAGRRLLLPGDLEGFGQDQLMHQLRPVDVLLTAHHGAVNANPFELADRLRPTTVITSSGHTDSIDHLNHVYAESSELYFTRNSGALTVDVEPDGTVDVREFLSPSNPPF